MVRPLYVYVLVCAKPLQTWLSSPRRRGSITSEFMFGPKDKRCEILVSIISARVYGSPPRVRLRRTRRG